MTIDDKLYWAFKYQQPYYGARLNRRNALMVSENSEIFLDTEDGNMSRTPINICYIVNCSSWKQAFLYTYYTRSNNSFLKMTVKNEHIILGNGIIARLDGTVLLNGNKGIIDRTLISGNAPAASLEGTFLKTILPMMASFTARTLQIKDSSSFKKEAAKPNAIGKELNAKLIECAKNSLELVDL